MNNGICGIDAFSCEEDCSKCCYYEGDRENYKKVDFYSYCDDKNGNIEVNFNIDGTDNYRLVITEKDLRSMLSLSNLGKLL